MVRSVRFFLVSILGTVAACGGHAARRQATVDPGVEKTLRVTLSPGQVVRGRGGEVLELALTLDSHFDAAARARWGVEIVDDRGRAAAPIQISPPVSLPAPGAGSEDVIRTPAALPDGFYVVRVTAAGKSGEQTAAAVTERYLEVRAGEITPIDSDDYHTRSQALLEVTP